MPVNDPNELDKVDQKIRINELKRQAEELAGGEMTFMKGGSLPPEIEEAFLKSVVDYEKRAKAPQGTDLERLEKSGVKLPKPGSLKGKALEKKIFEIVKALQKINVYIASTNHLTDEELYAKLWNEILREPHPDFSKCRNGAWTHDILGCCSDEDIDLQMKYYADKKARARFKKEFPKYKMPRSAKPPSNRDKKFPYWIPKPPPEDFDGLPDIEEFEAD
jgi:hypothetical protein